MTEFSLRPAREKDAKSIRELIYLVGINPVGLDWKRFAVAVDPEDEIIGCGQIKPHGQQILELASIAVRPEHRNQGIARAVIECLLADSPRPLYLMCRSRMGSLYEKFGFHAIEYERMPRYFQRMSKLAGLADVLISTGDTLLVMKLE
jgi:N-acetylglutamate synthase-like GNAT family acetyltransferase